MKAETDKPDDDTETDKPATDTKADKTSAEVPSRGILPPGDGVPRSPSVTVPMPRVGIMAGKTHAEPDHAGVAKAKEDAATRAKAEADARKDRRQRVRGGTLSGKWVPFGNSLVNMDAVTAIELPTEGAEVQTLTVTTFGGKTVSASGDEAAEIMEELQLKPLPKAGQSSPMVMREDGRILSAEDVKATEVPGRVNVIPNHPHRANAVLTNAETDFDVTHRAGSAVIPPTRENVTIPPGESPPDATAGRSEGGEGEGDDEAATGTDARDVRPAPSAPRAGKPKATGKGRK